KAINEKVNDKPYIVNTAPRCEKPKDSKRWCKCILSADDIGCLLNLRRIIANTVSVIGTPKINIGVTTEIKVAFFKLCNETTAIMNPKNKAPVSPKNIVAG